MSKVTLDAWLLIALVLITSLGIAYIAGALVAGGSL